MSHQDHPTVVSVPDRGVWGSSGSVYSSSISANSSSSFFSCSFTIFSAAAAASEMSSSFLATLSWSLSFLELNLRLRRELLKNSLDVVMFGSEEVERSGSECLQILTCSKITFKKVCFLNCVTCLWTLHWFAPLLLYRRTCRFSAGAWQRKIVQLRKENHFHLVTFNILN